jgi:hypothetical protein
MYPSGALAAVALAPALKSEYPKDVITQFAIFLLVI